MGLEDVIFSDTESARDPRDGREETSVRVIKRDIVVTVGVVDGSIGWLLFQDGEE